MTERPGEDPGDEMCPSLGRKVEAFVAGLDPDERQVFAASLFGAIENSPGEDARAFGMIPDLSSAFAGSVSISPSQIASIIPSSDCTWRWIGTRLCWVCGTRTMYCKGL